MKENIHFLYLVVYTRIRGQLGCYITVVKSKITHFWLGSPLQVVLPVFWLFWWLGTRVLGARVPSHQKSQKTGETTRNGSLWPSQKWVIIDFTTEIYTFGRLEIKRCHQQFRISQGLLYMDYLNIIALGWTFNVESCIVSNKHFSGDNCTWQ